MAIEIKIDNPSDEKYLEDKIETSNLVEIYQEQIKMALGSELGSIMGADVTMDLEAYVFEFELSTQELAKKTREIIGKFCSLYPKFDTDINVGFAKGEIRDVCLISIEINGGNSVKVLIM